MLSSFAAVVNPLIPPTLQKGVVYTENDWLPIDTEFAKSLTDKKE